tara:strand:+ start:673 stop:1338 length:666 start_codon:yes stop_codon:yes gene_type:complete
MDFDRFTEQAINALFLAQEESRRLGHNFVGSEQILLGLISHGSCIAAKVLKYNGLNLKDSRIEVELIDGKGSGNVQVEIPFTLRAKRILELSSLEAIELNHDYVGTEHILLAILREGEGCAVRVIENFKVDTEKLKSKIFEYIRISNEKLTSKKFNFNKINFSDEASTDLLSISIQKQLDRKIELLTENFWVSQLERLAFLRKKGLLTQEEFIEAKRKLLL